MKPKRGRVGRVDRAASSLWCRFAPRADDGGAGLKRGRVGLNTASANTAQDSPASVCCPSRLPPPVYPSCIPVYPSCIHSLPCLPPPSASKPDTWAEWTGLGKRAKNGGPGRLAAAFFIAAVVGESTPGKPAPPPATPPGCEGRRPGIRKRSRNARERDDMLVSRKR